MEYTIKKKYPDYPFAHRQHKHVGFCRYCHGHNWLFVIEIGCYDLDEQGFVLDFGKMKFIKNILDEAFDHTLVLSQNDEYLSLFQDLAKKNLAKLTIIPNDASAEGIASYVGEVIDSIIKIETSDRAYVKSIELFEDSKDSAIVRFK